MAGVLDALASYVTNMLAEMAREEVAMLIGVSSGIDNLGVKLRDLKNVLADADRRNITDESVRGWVEELKRAMYQATDIIDICQLKAMERRGPSNTGCLNSLLFCMQNPRHAHEIGTRIKKLNQNLDDINKRGVSFSFIKLEAYQGQKTTRSLATDRKTDSLIERSGVVGEKIQEHLEILGVHNAPAIKRVGPEFVQPYSHRHHASTQIVAAFPKLHVLFLVGMVEWEEWDWEEEVQAMPILEDLKIRNCKLRCIPSGLASHAQSLKKLTIYEVQHLQSLENFSSVVELDLYRLPELTSISNFPKLKKLEIDLCPKLESLLLLTVYYSKKPLPVYLQTVKPCHLLLDCSPELLSSMALGRSGPEWERFSHIQHVEAYADDVGTEKRWHLYYTSEPYNMEANIDPKEYY